MIPHRTPFILPLLYSSLHWRFPAEGKTLYLTFDDGPVPGPTEFVLETLAHHAVTATFFCIGENIERYSDLFGRLIKEGGWATTRTIIATDGEPETTLILMTSAAVMKSCNNSQR